MSAKPSREHLSPISRSSHTRPPAKTHAVSNPTHPANSKTARGFASAVELQRLRKRIRTPSSTAEGHPSLLGKKFRKWIPMRVFAGSELHEGSCSLARPTFNFNLARSQRQNLRFQLLRSSFSLCFAALIAVFLAVVSVYFFSSDAFVKKIVGKMLVEAACIGKMPGTIAARRADAPLATAPSPILQMIVPVVRHFLRSLARRFIPRNDHASGRQMRSL